MEGDPRDSGFMDYPRPKMGSDDLGEPKAYVCPEGEGNKDTNPKDIIGSSKPGVSSVPIQVMAEVGNAMLEGQKYGRHNYRAAGVRASVYLDAVWRHLFVQWWDNGEDVDEASQLNHVTKAIAGLCVLRDSMLQGNFEDDRPPKANLTMTELQTQATNVINNIEPLPAWTEKRMMSRDVS